MGTSKWLEHIKLIIACRHNKMLNNAETLRYLSEAENFHLIFPHLSCYAFPGLRYFTINISTII
jgi:hypothetical protein